MKTINQSVNQSMYIFQCNQCLSGCWLFLHTVLAKFAVQWISLIKMSFSMCVLASNNCVSVLKHSGFTGSTCQASPCRGSRPSLPIFSAEQHSARCSTCHCFGHCRRPSNPRPNCPHSDGSSPPLVDNWLYWICSQCRFYNAFYLLFMGLKILKISKCYCKICFVAHKCTSEHI